MLKRHKYSVYCIYSVYTPSYIVKMQCCVHNNIIHYSEYFYTFICTHAFVSYVYELPECTRAHTLLYLHTNV